MSLKLYRLGQWSFRNRWWVISAWVAILATVVISLAVQGGARITSAVTIDGTESERVINELHEEFPEMSGSQGTIVFRSAEGTRLDEEPTSQGLKQLASDIESLDSTAERPDLRELLPGFQEIPDDIDFDELQALVAALPAGINLSDYRSSFSSVPEDVDVNNMQAVVRSLPEDTDLASLQSIMAQIPEDLDLASLRDALSELPENVDVSQLQAQLANIPAGVDPTQLRYMMPELAEGTDLGALQQTLSQLPAGIDLAPLQALFSELPANVDVKELHRTFQAIPKDINLDDARTLMLAVPEDVNLQEMRTQLANVGPETDMEELRDLVASLPEGTSISEIKSITDVPLLTVDGEQVSGMLLSEDGSTVMFQIQLAQQIEDLNDADLAGLITLAQDAADSLGIDVYISESLSPQTAPLGGTEAFGLLVAALVLILTLGTLRAAGLPLITALVGVGVGLGGVLALSHTIELTSATPVLALMVGLAVGIDYALFIVNRARGLILNEGKSAYAAAGQAVGTAGSAVVFAGLTVVIALTGLTLIGISFLTTMALVAATTVALAVLVALTLLPALLGVAGERLVSKRARSKGNIKEVNKGVATRWAHRVIASRGAVTLLIIGVLAAIAIPAASMSFGMPSGSTANLHTDERQAHDAISESFGEGYNAPLLTVITATEGKQIDAVDLPIMALNLRDVPGVHTAQPMGLSEDGSVAIVSVIPENGPNSSETTELVHELRKDGMQVIGIDAASFGVTGLTAVNLDISEKLADVLPIYISIIVMASLIILLLVFRSILIPIKATGGFLLSIGTTFGIITAVFQWGWAKDLFGFDTTGPILSFLPIMVTGILYGLAMDYEIFLITSMRQAYVEGFGDDEAIVEGFSRASRVVVAAATIMVAVFAGFIFSDDPMVKQFGTALSIGIFIDAFVVRLTLIPAIMSFLGKSAWWLPKWVDRILPNLDVEGHALSEHLAQIEGTVTEEVTVNSQS